MLLSKGTKMRLENNISFKIVELMNNLKFSEIRGYQKLIVHMNDKKLSPCKNFTLKQFVPHIYG